MKGNEVDDGDDRGDEEDVMVEMGIHIGKSNDNCRNIVTWITQIKNEFHIANRIEVAITIPIPITVHFSPTFNKSLQLLEVEV